MRYLSYLFLLTAALTAGCIRNDIPYPVVTADITAFEVAGQSAVDINATLREVRVTLRDTVDLKKVRLLKFEVSNDATVAPEPEQYIDLSSPKTYTLTTYQQYVWKIKAEQTIERYVTVENQVGSAIIDEGNRSVLVNVAQSQPFTDIHILTMKLGPSNAVTTPDPKTVTDFTKPQTFTVEYRDVTEQWTMRVMHSEVSVTTEQANAWARFSYLAGTFVSGSGAPTFEYRKAIEQTWSQMPENEITVTGGQFSAKLSGLEPGTDYVCRSTVGQLRGNEVAFTTETEAVVPNLSFDDWFKNGKTWYPDKDLSEPYYYWDSGNKGANLLSEVNPTQPDSIVVVKGKAAKMASTTVFGVFAAGSVYLGQFGKTIGTSGAELYFGRKFSGRPIRLKGYYNYLPGVIDKAKGNYERLLGTQDSCHIYALLADWDAPFTINTAKNQFIDFKNDTGIIAFGELKTDQKTNGYKTFTIDLDYRSLTRKPKYMVIVGAASKYGDYFTGSTSSVLYLDELALDYE